MVYIHPLMFDVQESPAISSWGIIYLGKTNMFEISVSLYITLQEEFPLYERLKDKIRHFAALGHFN